MDSAESASVPPNSASVSDSGAAALFLAWLLANPVLRGHEKGSRFLVCMPNCDCYAGHLDGGLKPL